MRACLALALLCMLLAACNRHDASGPLLSGLIVAGDLDEISGIAASRRHRDTLWVHEDGGSGTRLHAITRRGRRLASIEIAGVANTDWEDLAAFELDGKPYLLIADTGDNGGLRRTLQLHIVPEPATLAAGVRLHPAWSLVFRWPDGPRDCEAVAVDARARQVLLVSKKRRPPELFALPLRPGGTGVLTARRIGRLGGIPQFDPETAGLTPTFAHILSQVTAADLSPDGRSLAVLTYRHALWYRRPHADAPWPPVLRAPHAVRPLPFWLQQAEALAWARNGRGVFITGELSPAPLVYLPRSPDR
jgi:hypothetical protein